MHCRGAPLHDSDSDVALFALLSHLGAAADVCAHLSEVQKPTVERGAAPGRDSAPRPGPEGGPGPLARTNRHRKVSTRRVAEAYGGDLDRAMADTDEQVAATVAAWERAHGVPVRDWRAIGREERTGDKIGVQMLASLKDRSQEELRPVPTGGRPSAHGTRRRRRQGHEGSISQSWLTRSVTGRRRSCR
jgi:hypothetical protein